MLWDSFSILKMHLSYFCIICLKKETRIFYFFCGVDINNGGVEIFIKNFNIHKDNLYKIFYINRDELHFKV